MDFRWPWEHDDTIVLIAEEPAEDRDAYLRQLFRRLRHIAEQNNEILALLRPPVAQQPVSVTIVTIEGATMADIQIAPGEIKVFKYTETDAAGNQVSPLQGTPSWSVPDPNAGTAADNGDGTVSLTGGTEGAASSLDLTVTMPDGSTFGDSDALTVAAPVAPAVAAQIVPA